MLDDFSGGCDGLGSSSSSTMNTCSNWAFWEDIGDEAAGLGEATTTKDPGDAFANPGLAANNAGGKLGLFSKRDLRRLSSGLVLAFFGAVASLSLASSDSSASSESLKYRRPLIRCFRFLPLASFCFFFRLFSFSFFFLSSSFSSSSSSESESNMLGSKVWPCERHLSTRLRFSFSSFLNSREGGGTVLSRKFPWGGKCPLCPHPWIHPCPRSLSLLYLGQVPACVNMTAIPCLYLAASSSSLLICWFSPAPERAHSPPCELALNII